MLLLALDTSTPAVTVAVHDGASVLAEVTTLDARRHGELLAPGIQRVLADAAVGPRDLTDVVVGVGPGPFTGLRVGIVTARVMSSTLGVALHGVCSLDALAAAAEVDGDFLVATDARRREVYWARYTSSTTRAGDPSVGRPAEVAASHPELPVVGPGGALYPDVFGDRRGPGQLSAGALATLAVTRLTARASFLPTTPLYLRRPDVMPPAPRKRVTAS